MNPDTHYAVGPGWRVLLSDMGISVANVLRRADLPRDLFARDAVSLTPSQTYALWRAVEDEADDPELPILLARSISFEAFDAPIFAASCSRNLNEASRRIAHYKKLIGPLRLTVTETPVETSLEVTYPSEPSPPPGFAMSELLFWVAFARLATRSTIVPVRVTTPHPPRVLDSYREYLGVDVRRGDAHTVVFSAVDASKPFLTANDRMWDFFEPELRRRLSDVERDTTVAQRVRASLLERLPAGDGSMEGVAGELAMSTRTLQRRLNGEGTSFQTVLNQTRESLARHYLSSSTMSAGEISFLLGYDDPRSFYRAFQAWTGQTPRLVRSEAV